MTAYQRAVAIAAFLLLWGGGTAALALANLKF